MKLTDKMKVNQRNLPQTDGSVLNSDAILWRVNANIERKFALSLAKDEDIRPKGKLQDFLT